MIKYEISETDENWVAILNDPHIAASQLPDAPIPSNLRSTVAWLCAQPKAPAAVVVNGDLAMFDGQPGDYEYFARLIKPLRDAGKAVYLMMGNHDDRSVFYNVLEEEKSSVPAVTFRQIRIVQLPHANLFLLDSLKQQIVAPGELGEEQRHWLSQALDEHADKPALLFVHHNPRFGGEPEHFPGGLEDSEELWKIIAPRKQVKAYIHGHIHHCNFFEHEGMHLLNLPSVGYVADEKFSTTGWTTLRLEEVGAEITIHTHRADHEWNGTRKYLRWRK